MRCLGVKYRLQNNRRGVDKCARGLFPRYILQVYRPHIRGYIAYTYVDSKAAARAFIQANKWIFEL